MYQKKELVHSYENKTQLKNNWAENMPTEFFFSMNEISWGNTQYAFVIWIKTERTKRLIQQCYYGDTILSVCSTQDNREVLSEN